MWGTWQVLTHYALRRGLGFSPAGETSPIDPALDAAISFGSHEWNWIGCIRVWTGTAAAKAKNSYCLFPARLKAVPLPTTLFHFGLALLQRIRTEFAA